MTPAKAILSLLILPSIGLVLAGCLNFQPVVDASRYFVLTPDPAMTPASPEPNRGSRVGIARAMVADYLQRRRIASRQGEHEMEYSENLCWAEPLADGVTRVLSVNLASLLGSTRVIASTWGRGDVEAVVYVAIQRFDSDRQGRFVLEAHWRITSPGAAQPWRTGQSRIVKQGPPPATDPDGLVRTMSLALADLSREIAGALPDASSPSRP